MTFVNQKTRYGSANRWLTVGEVRKVLADVRDDDAMVSYGFEVDGAVTGMMPWMTVRALRDAIVNVRDDFAVGPADLDFPHEQKPAEWQRTVIEIRQEDVLGQIVECSVAEPEVSVNKLRRRHRRDVWADADGFIWYVKDGEWHSDEAATNVKAAIGPFKRCVRP